jgi:hypothetical protein
MKRERHPLGWDNLHPLKLALFALLSVADLFMTWQLVQAGDGNVYESNPIANAWLASFGWTGLAMFKGLAMVMVAGAALYVSLYRPKTGGRILTFACSATAMVVLYSCYLCLHPEPLNAASAEEAFAAEQKGRILDKEMSRQKQYHALLAQLSKDLMAHRLTLHDAVARLAESDKARNPQWMAVLHRTYPGRSDAECLAIHLISHALTTAPHDLTVRQSLASQFEAEYQTTFGSEVLLDLALWTPNKEPSTPAAQPTYVALVRKFPDP